MRPKSIRTCVDCGGPVKRWNAVRCHPCKVKHRFPGWVVDPVTGCWNWQGGKDRHGYGLTKVGKRTVVAHRRVYEEHRGPIPDGMDLDHVVCQNHGCVNPWHVEPVTHAVNVRRGSLTKLTAEDVAAIRELAEMTTMTQEAIAIQFGISDGHVNNILRRRAWRDD